MENTIDVIKSLELAKNKSKQIEIEAELSETEIRLKNQGEYGLCLT